MYFRCRRTCVIIAWIGLLWSLLAALGTAQSPAGILDSGFYAEGDLVFERRMSDCLPSRNTDLRCIEQILFRDQVVEERILIVRGDGVWLAANLNPMTGEVETYTPHIPIIYFSGTPGVARGTYEARNDRHELIDVGMWSVDLRLIDSYTGRDGLLVRKHHTVLRLMDYSLKRHRQVELTYAIKSDGTLVSKERKVWRQTVQVDSTAWYLVDSTW